MLVIIDYGMGNLGSIGNMLKKIGVPSLISSGVEEIERAERLILPGVGAFDNGMKNLEEMGLIPLLNRRVREEGVPVLGICLGMQLLGRSSQEGQRKGLGWIEGETRRFCFGDSEERLKVPHMGWNTVQIRQGHRIMGGLEESNRFYFVHSYHLVALDERVVVGLTHYGYDFVSCVADRNVMGVQFHPEKSHKFGMRLLSNFVFSF